MMPHVSSPEKALAKELAERIFQLRSKAASTEVIQSATNCAVDFFAVSLAGFREPSVGRVARSIAQVGGTSEATVLWGGDRTSASLAAMANGYLAHVLDYDDTLWTYIGHSTAVIFPAALAVAEAFNCSGLDLLTAFSLGVEAAHLIGSPITPQLSKRGWHPSPVVGVFGAAVSSSLLMGGGIKSTASALTISTNLATGIRQNFGSGAKPLAIGWASYAGVVASVLAQQGISGSENAFEGRQGFYRAFAGAIPKGSNDMRNSKMAIVSPGVAFKLYPCCTGAHPAIDAILKIRKEYVLPPDEITSVRIEVTPEVLDELIYPFPSNPWEARFSLPYCASVALVYGRVGLDHFLGESLQNSIITGLMGRIEVQANEKLFRLGGDHCPAARVTIITRGGREISSSVNAARGNPGNPISFKELQGKFHHCADTAGLPEESAEKFLHQIMDIRKVDSVSTWMQSTVAPLFKKLV
jgi:2-methylcitrate dehydratase PrpD